MGNLYEDGINPFQDYLMDLLINNVDISNLRMYENIESVFIYILSLYLKNEKDVLYLDFDIIRIDNKYELIANNIITALWFSGIMPEDIDEVMYNGYYEFDGVKYTYNETTHELIIK